MGKPIEIANIQILIFLEILPLSEIFNWFNICFIEGMYDGRISLGASKVTSPIDAKYLKS